MYKKGLGDFFLFVSGGPESQYPNEDIIPLSLADAREWIERVRGGDIVAQFITEKDEAALNKQNKAAVKKSSKSTKKTPAKKSTSKKSAAKKSTSKKSTSKKTTKKDESKA